MGGGCAASMGKSQDVVSIWINGVDVDDGSHISILWWSWDVVENLSC